MATLETWIGLRYLRAKKRSGFMSFISLISIIGIALGVIVLITVLSVVNGFQKDIRGKLLNIAPHAEVGYMMGDGEQNQKWQDLQKMFDGKNGVIATAPYIAGQGLIANQGEVQGIQLRGILPGQERKVVDYADNLVSGSLNDLKPDEFDIVLGESLAQNLGAEIGNKVTVITPEGNVTPAGVVPRLKQFTVVGIVKTGADEADNSMAMIHMADAQKLFRVDDAAISLRLRLADPQNAPAVMEKLLPENQRLNIWAQNWTDNNRSYFNAVEMEKRLLTLLLAFIILVAVFNLVSSLVMAVTEKQSDIAILRTLGMSPRGVMKVFVVQGMVAGVVGTASGTILGLALAANVGKIVAFIEQNMGRKLVSSKVYFLDYLPSDIHASDVISVICISLTLSFLATLYPSWRAARTQPAEALRYE
ncbi:lipoprotein-releasing ABC transporter permease subunit [Kingella negevensis]|uniref:lipoprotein-releasing ABC transporter permease subunit n=1 Tax=Kingella negevensis TaxID=1522312 RepID=UPI00254E771B|nr:lipoprotein-releasing ABC transporter permease subunit [Kingella negevensis]MDK4679783.1 lipoprotein-releasing ABC transporter permease subunit [Kingella negevensis]MDK4682498.1 lipoprotein-releasing ABC transporter permease subunit [Kingella negevensis]MDK4690694.1 lipoprotein-releasing ABC transporter permease subunit [Kingella negevensis]MDK4694158.1 lipoprotein-releasing ABC transporter permease subunit [Kingella negevensis]MDK4699887.1 lipoprotein-releasing ABC transporter permease sub